MCICVHMHVLLELKLTREGDRVRGIGSGKNHKVHWITRLN